MSGRRVCFVTANTFALNAFLAGPIERLAADGWSISVVLNAADGEIGESVRKHAKVHHIPLVRAIAPWHDAANLWRLWRLFLRERFDVVHSMTPKAGLLAMVASRLAGVPRRLHTFTGQVWATRTGAMRWLLRNIDRLFAACATEVLADSPSQRELIAAEHVAPRARINVLAQGSVCGVDTRRFSPNAQARSEVRAQLGIEMDAPVLLYVGRLHPEKGLGELAQAFEALTQAGRDVHLVLAGPDEGGLALVQAALRAGRARLHTVGMTQSPERYMAAADMFCMPSYREGFGQSVLEAASAGLPCVASRIHGITDAIEDGTTGLLVPPRTVPPLAAAIEQLLAAPDLRARLGQAARLRACTCFSREVMLQAWSVLYSDQVDTEVSVAAG